jgi:hypothetical protein
MIGGGGAEDLVMVVHSRRVHWLHDACARILWEVVPADCIHVVPATDEQHGDAIH